MNDLIDLVARQAAITPAQAGIALRTILRVLGAGLPSPVMGQVSAFLASPAECATTGESPRSATLDDRSR